MPPAPSTTLEQAFDPDVLRDRYRHERDKRLRPDANGQYVDIAGPYAHYLEDPYVTRMERPARRDTVDVVVIGGGLAGLIAGARLRQAGIDDIRVVGKPAATSGEPGTGTAIRARSATSNPIATCRCWKSWARSPSTNTPSLPRSWSTAATSPAAMGSTTRRCCRPRSPSCAGMKRRGGGSSRPAAATAFRAGAWPWPTGRSTGRSCPASPASPSSRATPSTPAGGTTTTPAAIRRRPHRPEGQAGGDHRHRRHGGAMHSAPGRMGQGTLRLPAHAVIDRCARQPAPTRPGRPR